MISIQVVPVIDLIFAIDFSIWACAYLESITVSSWSISLNSINDWLLLNWRNAIDLKTGNQSKNWKRFQIFDWSKIFDRSPVHAQVQKSIKDRLNWLNVNQPLEFIILLTSTFLKNKFWRRDHMTLGSQDKKQRSL